ncbi:DUF6341 family protein [Capnocytophaga canimorsus]|uniref:Uracil phosphoribosyltransferase n=2 Tax=Capnocytophaga canimorsus TaxID=28188 RepID=F9YT72_CAPCC|nr:hypothetical protein [Capnocytophaga canimorsus]AEK23991.1 Conserved hypothetical protein [Capnocytophaga canimorsus Cc5]ATA76999.1 uracil phosphoribosyltransferase [Capnocytophaga canimorsus]ATA91561.1 uracil phosphoribosyltransferase [Capnocytophaga canimorsus]ATA93731.1 uracil phosphoribosyltransferase [Capnocytophaga canimorsus]AWL78459.1 uracil phosphoribosyltransferase [Capnocytophaga canimorsus]
MKSFFEAIEFLFDKILFIPLDFLRSLELENWWTANLLNWIFIIIGFVFFIYWLGQLNKFNKNKEDRTDVVSHSFFK